MAVSAHLKVDRLPDSIHRSQWLVLRQAMPGIERKAFTKLPASSRAEILSRNNDLGYVNGSRDGLVPFRQGVLDWCAIIHVALNEEIEPHFPARKDILHVLFQ